MKYDDLSFTTINEDGLEVICDIKAVIPNPDNDDEPFVKYTDYSLGENQKFNYYYGKLIEDDGDYALKNITDKEVLDRIKTLENDEVVQYVNNQIQENIE